MRASYRRTSRYEQLDPDHALTLHRAASGGDPLCAGVDKDVAPHSLNAGVRDAKQLPTCSVSRVDTELPRVISTAEKQRFMAPPGARTRHMKRSLTTRQRLRAVNRGFEADGTQTSVIGTVTVCTKPMAGIAG